MVGVDRLRRVARCRQDEIACLSRPVGTAEPLGEAENISQVVSLGRRHGIERSFGVAGFFDDGDACFRDRRRMASGPFGAAKAAVDVLRVEAHVHARLMIVCRNQAAERVQRFRLEVGAEGIVMPNVAQLRACAGTIALRQQGAREREMPLGRQWRVLRKISPYAAWGRLLGPHHRFRTPAHETDAGPVGIGGDEGDVA